MERAPRTEGRALFWQGVSVVFHVALLAAASLAMPPAEALGEGAGPDDQVYFFHAGIAPVAEPDVERVDVPVFANGLSAMDEGNALAGGTESDGKVGSTASDVEAGRLATAGPEDFPNPGPQQLGPGREATNWTPGLHPEPWGEPEGINVPEDMLGRDAESTRGNARGPARVTASGGKGASLTGSAEGGRQGMCTAEGGPPASKSSTTRAAGTRPKASAPGKVLPGAHAGQRAAGPSWGHCGMASVGTVQ